MAFNRYLALVPVEYLEDADERLAKVEWARQEQDTDADQRFAALVGTFPSHQTAMTQLHEVAPSAEPSIVRLADRGPQFLIASDETLSGVFGDLGALLGHVGPDEPVVPVAESKPASASEDGDEVGATNSKPTKAAPKAGDEAAKPATEPQVAPLVQTIEAGLKAMDIPPEFWKALSPESQRQFARRTLDDLYEDRSSYARNIRWSFAPDAELLSQAPDDLRSTLAVQLLKARAGIADHQLSSAAQDVALKTKSVDYAEQGVELRKKAVEQQAAVTDMLKEFLKHLERWRALSVLGAVLLVVTLAFSMVMIVWLVIVTSDGTPSEWSLPAAIFAFALFVISPAVLLLRERPLKGLDEAGWPGTAPAKPDQPAGTAGSGAQPHAPTAPGATPGAAPAPSPGLGHQ